MTEIAADRLIFADLETFGLNPKSDFILEIGFKIVTPDDFEEIDEFQLTLWDTPTYDARYDKLARDAEAGNTGAQTVLDMHTKSGLFTEARREGLSVEDAQRDCYDWLTGHGFDATEPLCGSSVHFDRAMLHAQMPVIEALFYYRNIDVSTIKELCRRFNPQVFARLEEVTKPVKEHRVLSDIEDTIGELAFYRQEFLMEE